MRPLSMALRTGDSPQQIVDREGSWGVEPPPALSLVCDVPTPGLLLLGNKWSSSCSTSRFVSQRPREGIGGTAGSAQPRCLTPSGH